MSTTRHPSIRSRGAACDEWLRRSERHQELVGAAQDARSTRVLLDTQLALAGDAEAERRLLESAGSAHLGAVDAGQARLGVAELAWRRRRYADALAHAEALAAVIAGAARATRRSRGPFSGSRWPSSTSR
jgi:hypothetical protein